MYTGGGKGGGDKEKGQAVWRGATGKGAQKRAAPMQTEPRVQPRRLVLPSAATRRLLGSGTNKHSNKTQLHLQTNKLQKRGVRVNHLRVDALLLSQEDFDTYLESILLAERRVGI